MTSNETFEAALAEARERVNDTKRRISRLMRDLDEAQRDLARYAHVEESLRVLLHPTRQVDHDVVRLASGLVTSGNDRLSQTEFLERTLLGVSEGMTREQLESAFAHSEFAKKWKDLRASTTSAIWRAVQGGNLVQEGDRYRLPTPAERHHAAIARSGLERGDRGRDG